MVALIVESFNFPHLSSSRPPFRVASSPGRAPTSCAQAGAADPPAPPAPPAPPTRVSLRGVGDEISVKWCPHSFWGPSVTRVSDFEWLFRVGALQPHVASGPRLPFLPACRCGREYGRPFYDRCMLFFNPPSLSISAEALRTLLWPAMLIDGHRVQPFVVDNAYGWIACTIYCGRQPPSMDTFPIVLWWATPIG